MPKEYCHISWLQHAIKKFQEDNTVVHSIDMNMTIKEFIEKWLAEDLAKMYIQ